MDDPVVAASAGSRSEAIFMGVQKAPKNSSGEIAEFFDDLKSSQSIFPGQESRHIVDGLELGNKNENFRAIAEQYSSDYKPQTTSNRQNVYSINELISISKQLPEGHVEEIIFTLPKKKFWRLNHRQQDYGNQGRSMGHRGSNKVLNGLSSSKGVVGEDSNNLFEKKGSKGKYSRMVNGKKNGKFAKQHDRAGFMEEKDVTVNHDDLQALEGEFEPTGNSMADFESWKAKMKEMERRKKGLPPGDSSVHPKSSLSKTSSSISDFLGLNKIQTDNASNQTKSDPVATEKKDTDHEDDGLDKDFNVPLESTKGSFSRFSSFFTQSSSSSPLPTVRDTQQPEGLTSRNARDNVGENMSISRSHKPSVPGGSKLLSFFNKEGSAPRNSGNQTFLNKGDQKQDPVNPQIVPPSDSSHGSASPPAPLRLTEERPDPPQPQSQLHSHAQSQSLPQQQQPISRPQNSSSPALTPDQLQTNNVFFQNLLNKSELQNQKRNPPIAPPPGVMLPSGIPPQSGQTPANMGISGPFPMGMPPPGPGTFPPGLPTGQAGVPLGMQPLGTTTLHGKARDGNDLSSSVDDNNRNSAKGAGVQIPSGTMRSRDGGSEMPRTQPPPRPLQPGMLPPQFIPGMAPPGFPMIPPTFNPMYVPPQNGLMPPPGGQSFFPAVLPPSHNMNFNAFPLQPPPVSNPQPQEPNSTKSKR